MLIGIVQQLLPYQVPGVAEKSWVRGFVPAEPGVVKRPVRLLLHELSNKTSVPQEFVILLRKFLSPDGHKTEERPVPLKLREGFELRLRCLLSLHLLWTVQVRVKEVPEGDILGVPNFCL